MIFDYMTTAARAWLRSRVPGATISGPGQTVTEGISLDENTWKQIVESADAWARRGRVPSLAQEPW